MAFLFEIKDATYKWLGIFCISFAIILVAFGIDMLRTTGKEDLGQEALGGCLPFLLVIGILFAYAGLKAERQKIELEKLAGYLKAYRRIKIPALASKLRMSEYETERRIIRCARLGLLTGYIDRASDEFFNPQGMEGKVLISCPNCGGSVEQMVMEGETGKCPYCGSLMAQAK
jgi:DNA-directed RNA polymerase subunit RPC12/RpoP